MPFLVADVQFITAVGAKFSNSPQKLGGECAVTVRDPLYFFPIWELPFFSQRTNMFLSLSFFPEWNFLCIRCFPSFLLVEFCMFCLSFSFLAPSWVLFSREPLRVLSLLHSSLRVTCMKFLYFSKPLFALFMFQEEVPCDLHVFDAHFPSPLSALH